MSIDGPPTPPTRRPIRHGSPTQAEAASPTPERDLTPGAPAHADCPTHAKAAHEAPWASLSASEPTEPTESSVAGEAGVEAASGGAHKGRLLKAFWSVPRGIHVLLLVICFVLGLAIASQVIAQHDDPFDSLSQQDLVVLLEELADREEELRTQRAELAKQLASLEDEATKRQAAQEAAAAARTHAQINAALVPVTGPGVEVTVRDPEKALRASHFVMTIGELRNAGAEAAEINGRRLTMRSAFTSDDEGISLDGKRLEAPYVWRVIGEGKTIATALEIPGGTASQMRAKGAHVDIQTSDEVRINSVAPAVTPQWATTSE